MAGDGGAYSPKAARYDWLTLNHFADMSAGGTGLTVSSPDLSFLRRGNSAPSWLDDQSSRISILAGGQVDGPSLGIPNQGGDAAFLQRFALETHGDYDAAAAMRFALEHQNPLETGEATGGTAYPGDSYSLFSVTAPGVFVWAVKPAEDTAGGGIVARLWNQAGSAADFGLQFNGFTVSEASRTTLIETPLESAPFQAGLVSGTIPGFGWRAYHVKLNQDAVWPAIHLSKTELAFGAERNSSVPPPEPVTVENGGTGSLNWQAAASADWLSVSPASGTGTGRAGWGYMLLTNFLPLGDGSYTLLAYAADTTGHEIEIGSKMITVNNATAVKPFGAIDTPEQGGAAAGSAYLNFGWVLTPQPDHVPADGSTLLVWVDGLPLGHPSYGHDREDIATLFPGYANSGGAVGFYPLNTTDFADGVHTIAWSAADSGGDEDGIGSRYFTIQNAAPGLGNASLAWDEMPEDTRTPVFVRRGLVPGSQAELVVPDADGALRISIPEVTRVAVYFNEAGAGETVEEMIERGKRMRSRAGDWNTARLSPETSSGSIAETVGSGAARSINRYEACELVLGEMRPLPIGASFDARDGVLYWQPGPGFRGEFQFVIIDRLTATKKKILIAIGW